MTKGDKWYPWKTSNTGVIDDPMNRPILLKISEIQFEDYIKGVFKSFSDVKGETIPQSPLQTALREARGNGEPLAQYITGINFARMSLVEVALIQPSDLLKENILEIVAGIDQNSTTTE